MNKLGKQGTRCALYGRATLGTLQVTDSVRLHGVFFVQQLLCEADMPIMGMRRKRDWTRFRPIDTFINYAAGFASLISLGVATLTLGRSLQNESADSTRVIVWLSIAFAFLAIALILLLFHSARQSFQFGTLVATAEELRSERNTLHLRLRSESDCLHNALHYMRYTVDELQRVTRMYITEDTELTEEVVSGGCRQFAAHLSTITNNVKDHMDVLTGDKCAVTLKIVNDDRVKTFYRDAVSYRRRKRSDYDEKGAPVIHSLRENFAFELIASPAKRNTTFVSDDLGSFQYYTNANPQWKQLYNATAVVPISIREKGKRQRRIIGFLCVDNFRGGFANAVVMEFLSAFGDSLYSLFTLYEELVTIAHSYGVDDERIKAFSDWGNSGQERGG